MTLYAVTRERVFHTLYVLFRVEKMHTRPYIFSMFGAHGIQILGRVFAKFLSQKVVPLSGRTSRIAEDRNGKKRGRFLAPKSETKKRRVFVPGASRQTFACSRPGGLRLF